MIQCHVMYLITGASEGSGNEDGYNGKETQRDDVWPAVAIHGLGSSKAPERVYVVWNLPDPTNDQLCEQSWVDPEYVDNWHHFAGQEGRFKNLPREKLGFGATLIGKTITGSFHLHEATMPVDEEDEEDEDMDEYGDLLEDGLVTGYDVETERHTVKWLGGINIAPDNYPTDAAAEIMEHDLMMTGTKMWVWHTKKGVKKLKQEATTLVRWYHNTDLQYVADAGEATP
jgi:hypothetical protein